MLEEIYFDRKGQARVKSIQFQVKIHAYEVYMQQRAEGKSIQEAYSYSKIYSLTKFYDVTERVAFNNGFSPEEKIHFLKDCMSRFNRVFDFSPQQFESVRKSKIANKKRKLIKQ